MQNKVKKNILAQLEHKCFLLARAGGRPHSGCGPRLWANRPGSGPISPTDCYRTVFLSTKREINALDALRIKRDHVLREHNMMSGID